MPDRKRSDYATPQDLLAALKTSLLVDGVKKSEDLIRMTQAEPDPAVRQAAAEAVNLRSRYEALLGIAGGAVEELKPSLLGAVARYGSAAGSGIARLVGPRVQGLIAGLLVMFLGLKGPDWLWSPNPPGTPDPTVAGAKSDKDVRGQPGGSGKNLISQDDVKTILKTVLEEVPKQQNGKADILEGSLKDLRERVNQLSAQTVKIEASLKDKAAALEKTTAEAKSAADGVAKKVTELAKGADDLKTKGQMLATSVKTLEGDLKTTAVGLEKKVGEVKAAADGLAPKVTALTKKTEALTAGARAAEDRSARIAEGELIRELTQKPLDNDNQKAAIKALLLARLVPVNDPGNPLFRNAQTPPNDALKTTVKFIKLPPTDDAAAAVLAKSPITVADLAAIPSFAEVVKKVSSGVQPPPVLSGLRAAWRTSQELRDLIGRWPDPTIPKLGGL